MHRFVKEMRITGVVQGLVDGHSPARVITLQSPVSTPDSAHGRPVEIGSVTLHTDERETVAAFLPGDTVRVTVTVERVEG